MTNAAHFFLRTGLTAVLLFFGGATATPNVVAASLRADVAAAALQDKYRALSAAYASSNPAWRPKPPATGSLIFIAPDEYSAIAQPSGAVTSNRTKYADALFQLASDAAEAGQLSLAFQWATETLRENPDHAEARRVLGYEKLDDRWLTAYGAKMFNAGKVWNSAIGWTPTGEADSSPTVDQSDATRHAEIKNGWQVRTDHFLVTTNHSLAAGADLAARLERLYQVWRQLFAGFYYTEQEVRGLFAGQRVARTQIRPFRVFYYRDRDQYTTALSRRQPRIAETLGIYFDQFREAHFFASDGATASRPPVATLYHEAVHQLFQEAKPTSNKIGATANVWIIEGVATYFETLTEHNHPLTGPYYTIGQWTAGRLPAARERLRDDFYIPLDELAKFNKADMQRHPELAKLYSQAAGLTAFLLDGSRGRHREPLVQYLQAVYSGRDRAESLTESVGISSDQLDAAYRQYVESLPKNGESGIVNRAAAGVSEAGAAR